MRQVAGWLFLGLSGAAFLAAGEGEPNWLGCFIGGGLMVIATEFIRADERNRLSKR